jgi:hypothetical protein
MRRDAADAATRTHMSHPLPRLGPGPLTDAPLSRRRTALPRQIAAVLALVVTLGMQAGLWQVVRGAVHQGELRREATARESAAIWQCRALRSRADRADCLQRVSAPKAPDLQAVGPTR